MTASQRKIQFFDDSKEDLENKIESIEKKLDLIIDLLKNLKND